MIGDILHNILLVVDINDILNCYIAFRPHMSLERYLELRSRTTYMDGVFISYIPTNDLHQYGWCVISGIIHSAQDRPAMIDNNATFWYRCGKLHRDNDMPAFIHKNMDMYWYRNGKLHRDNDRPAIVTHDGNQLWYYNGVQYKSEICY